MCGLVGVVAKNMWKAHVDAFNDLLWIDQVRGRHSTGVASIAGHKRDELRILKEAVRPDILQDMRRYDFVVNHGAYALIGHNRYATVGAINAANAHPFVFPSLVGAQNGTIPHAAFKQFAADFGEAEFGTDTESLYYLIDKLGVEQVIPKVWGAWALSWFDREAKTMNFLRNKERPLFIAVADDRSFLFWASERHMLDFALDRYPTFAGKYKCFYLEPDKLYTIDMSASAKTIEFTAEPLEGGTAPPAPAHAHGRANLLPFVPREEKKTGTQSSTTTPDISKGGDGPGKDTTSVGKHLTLLKGYKGEYIDKEEFNARTKRGCEWFGPKCLINVEWSDVRNGRTPIKWLDTDQFLCTECKDHPETIEFLRCY